MAWPTPSDYQDAIQNPPTCFQDPRLRGAQPALGPLGLPKVASGNYCSVYELRAGSRRWAVRCFNRQVPDINRRYRTIDEHLNHHPNIPCIVGFDYLNEGIRIHGRWYPLVVMDWVEGSTLSRYLEKRVKDGAAVRALADQWPQVMADLRAAGITHGDLQHGNIMVEHGGAIRLVDYDNLFVPAFRGERSAELGRIHYQHPGRTADDFDENIGNFAALVIYLTLRALAADPSLWQYYNGENLVLTVDDYKRPGASPAFAQMHASPDPLVPPLARALARACALPVSQVPPLDEVLARVGAAGPAPRAAPSPGPLPPGGRADWLNSPAGPAQRPAPAPQRPAPIPGASPAPGGGWWEGPPAAAPQAPAPVPRRGQTPGSMGSSRSRTPPAAAGPGGAGTVAMPGGPAAPPRRAQPQTARPGCLASLFRSCMMTVVLLWIAAFGLGLWAYQTYRQTGQLPRIPGITLPSPSGPGTSGPTTGSRPETRSPGPPPGSVPRPGTGETGQERQPAKPPGPPAARPPNTRPPAPKPSSTPLSLVLLRDAEARLRAGDAAAALEKLNQARPAGLNLSDRATAARYYAARAEALYKSGQYAAAVDPFEQALRLDPGNDRLRLLYGQDLETLGRLSRAREQYARLANQARSPDIRREARRRLDRLGSPPGPGG